MRGRLEKGVRLSRACRLTGVMWPTCISVGRGMAIKEDPRLCWGVSVTGVGVAAPLQEKSTTTPVWFRLRRFRGIMLSRFGGI